MSTPDRRPAPTPAVEGQILQLPGGTSTAALSGAARRTEAILRRAFGAPPSPFITVDSAAATVRFDHVAGQIPLGRTVYLVRPKFMSQPNWTARLATWAAAGHEVRPRSITVLDGPVDARSMPTGLADLLARHYAALLKHALDNQPLAGFQRVRRSLPAARGRLLVAEAIVLPPHRRHLLPYEFSRLETSVPALRLLAWTTAHLQQLSRMPSSRQVLRTLSEQLPPSSAAPPEVTIEGLRLPPGSDAYREPLRIAVALAAGARAATAAERRGGTSSASLAVCTYAAFEGLVSLGYREAARRLGLGHRQQDRVLIAQRSAAPAVRHAYAASQDSRIASADDVITGPGQDARTRFTSDTKYKIGKPFRAKVDREDLYQVFTTAVAAGTAVAAVVQPLDEIVPKGTTGVEILDVPGGQRGALVRIGLLRLDLRGSSAGPVADSADQLARLIVTMIQPAVVP